MRGSVAGGYNRGMMEFAIGMVVGLVAGAFLAWVLLRARRGEAAGEDPQLVQAQTRAEELRRQLDETRTQSEGLRENLDTLQQARVKAETELAAAREHVQEQKKFVEESRAKLTEAFGSLSGKALKDNNEAFLALAKKSLEAVMETAKGDLTARKKAVDDLVKPVAETLKKYETHIGELAKERRDAYTALREQVKGLAQQQETLRKETGNLVTALRRPQVRGRWGEVTLKRVVELAGMVNHVDFDEQVQVDEANRPDMVVHMPGGRDIVVDAKAPLDAYLDAMEAPDEETRSAHLARHAQQVRKRMRELAAKAYWEKFDESPEFVVMFIPGESFLSAALDKDHTLIEDGMTNRVVLATPTTLVTLLRAVAFGWRQEKVAQNAAKISELGKELYDRLRVTLSHVVKLGRSLGQATEQYNKTVGSIETRVLPSARRFQELAAARKKIEPLPPIDNVPRKLTVSELDEEEENSPSSTGSLGE